MKILMVVPRQHDINEINYSYVFPVGLGYISSVLKKNGHSVHALNLNHLEGTTEDLVRQALSKEDYDVVCTGHITLGYRVIKKIINSVKDYKSNHNPKIKIILGGPIVTSEPETIFNLLNPDFAVIGEGEETIIDLLDSIKKNKNLEKVKGIAFRDKNGRLIFTEKREPPKDLDKIPFPDLESLGFEEYINNLYANLSYAHTAFDSPRIYSILGSRGCPFNCTFCYHYSRYRKRSVDNIMKELEIVVKKYKINIILFDDECISLDKERLYELCKRVKKLREEVSWEIKWIISLTVRNVDEEMLNILKESGVNSIGYGFESFSPIILKSMNKPITPEMINNAFHKTIKAGINVAANFIFGDVAETKETARETFKWWEKNCMGQINLGLISPYPGSAIYNHCLKKGIIKDKVDFIENKITKIGYYNMTDNMSDDEFEQLKKKVLMAGSKSYKFVLPTKVMKIDEKVYAFRIECPSCKKIITYKNCFIKNKYTYDFDVLCRECNFRFFIVSPLRKLVYQNYPLFLFLNNLQKKSLKILKLNKT